MHVSIRTLWGAAISALVVAGTSLVLIAQRPAAGPSIWDPAHSEDLVKALHHMHSVWNSGDIPALKQLMMGDDQLVTFELDPNTHSPIRLKSKKEIDGFVDDVVKSLKTQSATTVLEMPAITCRANATFGVCTEECTIHLKLPDGSERIDRLFSTATALKTSGGWRWIQWHMSIGTPSEFLKDGKPTTPGDGSSAAGAR
jgi:hypothetical protein